MKKAAQLTGAAISGIGIIVNGVLSIFGYRNPDLFHRNIFAYEFFAVFTIISAVIINEAILKVPRNWFFSYTDEKTERYKKGTLFYVFRAIWVLAFLYILVCCARNLALDKTLLAYDPLPVIVCLATSAFGILWNLEYLLYHIVTLCSRKRNH